MTSVEPAPIKAAHPEHDVKAIPLEARKPQDRPAEVCAFQAGKRHSQVPEDVPTTVTILHLGRNRFKAFPSEVLSFQRLTHLNLYRNAIREVPGQLNTFCPNLKFLNVASNKLKECPAGLGGLPLEQLDLSGNRIRLLRENVAFLKELKELFICHNKLSYLPKEIGDLENLETLVAGHNRLKALPNSIGGLTRLTRLYIQANRIKLLPPELGKVRFDVPGSSMKLYKNPLSKKVFEAQLSQGAAGVSRFLASVEYQAIYDTHKAMGWLK